MSVWPSLNHAAVRRIQKAEALFFLVGCSILTIIDIQLSQVVYAMALAWVTTASPCKAAMEISLGFSLHLPAMILAAVGIVSTGTVFFFF